MSVNRILGTYIQPSEGSPAFPCPAEFRASEWAHCLSLFLSPQGVWPVPLEPVPVEQQPRSEVGEQIPQRRNTSCAGKPACHALDGDQLPCGRNLWLRQIGF